MHVSTAVHVSPQLDPPISCLSPQLLGEFAELCGPFSVVLKSLRDELVSGPTLYKYIYIFYIYSIFYYMTIWGSGLVLRCLEPLVIIMNPGIKLFLFLSDWCRVRGMYCQI